MSIRSSILMFMLVTAPNLQAAPAWDTGSDTWVATDALGRTLPTIDQAGALRPGKAVGIFYFLWLTETRGPVYDITKLLAANPGNPQYGPAGAFHWWGEPLFGYYRSTDDFVIRKHAQMLNDAGVDTLIFDVTNGFTYDECFLRIGHIFAEIRRTGQTTPSFAFLTHSRGARVVQHLYDQFYSKGLHSDLWFRWKGKPLILAAPAGLNQTLRDFFTVRESWAWTDPNGWFGNGKDKWPWIDHCPQVPGWHDQPEQPEQLSVCAAQHPISNIGRSFSNGRQPPPDQATPEKGLCFREQARRALEINPAFLFITGWNEWIAQRFISGGRAHFLGRQISAGDTYFVDQYNQEYSRDIEPMQGGHGDNYYYQMVDLIRRFKGVRSVSPVTLASIKIDGQFDDWEKVAPEFRDTIGDPVRRNEPGYGTAGPYVNTTGRNDIVAAKVTFDTDNVYFYVRTREPLTPATDPNWMLLLIDADNNPQTGWLGYDLVVNRTGVKPNVTKIEKHDGNQYRWGSVIDTDFRTSGNELELAVPRSLLTLEGSLATINFKWADNVQQTGEAADFTLNGDAAPNDRFNWRARL